jgi:prepilin-type N-terminal cleavage/methylation domain-containing protein
MNKSRHADLGLRSDDGFSLTELLVAMIVGLVVIFAILQVLDTSFSLSRRTQQRMDAAQRGRLAMDLVARELRAQTCLSDTEPSLVSASNSDITYYVNLGLPNAVPERHQLSLASGDLTLRRWIGTPAAAGVIPSVTYPASPTSTSTLLENVATVGSTPLFRYYSWGSGSSPTPSTLLATPLVAANIALPVKIGISFAALPDRAFNTSKPSATFDDSVYMRLADPTDPTHGQACA